MAWPVSDIAILDYERERDKLRVRLKAARRRAVEAGPERVADLRAILREAMADFV